MDWGTHVVLAGKLLETCGLSKGGAIYSVLPVIDIKPIHYHRQYAHLLTNQPTILEVAKDIFGSAECRARDFAALRARSAEVVARLDEETQEVASDPNVTREELLHARNRAYFYRRISDEAERFITNELDGSVQFLGEEALDISTDTLTAAVSLISHTFFDTFNNPVNVFIPYAANYAADWDMWKQIDYLDFKATFYNKDHIVPFRTHMQQHPVWTEPVNAEEEEDADIRERIAGQLGQPYLPQGLIKGMVQRLGDKSQGISPDAVDLGIRNFFAYLGEEDVVHADREVMYLKNVEHEIRSFITEMYSL